MPSVATSPHGPRRPKGPPPLENGDRLDQKTFHQRYEATPPDVRAELIGGVDAPEHAALMAKLAK